MDIVFIAYLGWQILSIPFTGTWASGRTALETSVLIGLVYLVLRGGINKHLSFAHLSRLIVVAAFIQSAIAILQHLDFFPWTEGFFSGFESQATGTLGGANILGAFLGLSIPFVIHLLASRKSKSKLGWFLALVVIIVALILSKSRGAWLAACFGLVVMNWRHIRHVLATLVKKKVLLLFASIIVLVAICVSAKGIYELNPASANGRLFIWCVALDMIRDHWLLGVGHGSFDMQWLEYQGAHFASGFIATDPGRAVSLVSAHSQLLNNFAETGVIGLSLFLLLFTVAFRQLIKSTQHGKPEDIVLISALTILFVHGMVEDVLISIPVQLLLVIILAMPLRHPAEEQVKTNSQKVFSKWLYVVVIPLLLFASLSTHISIQGELLSKEGRELTGSNKWEAGIAKYVSALEYQPNNHELIFSLGAAYSMIGESTKAIELIEESKEGLLDKNQYIALGKAYLDLKDYEQALYNLNKVLYYYPGLISPHFWISRAYYEMGDLQNARNELQVILDAKIELVSPEIEMVKRDARRVLNQINSRSMIPRGEK